MAGAGANNPGVTGRSGENASVGRTPCAQCGKPTKRSGRKFCSRSCSALSQQDDPNSSLRVLVALEANRKIVERRVIRRIVDDCKPYLDADRKLALPDAVRLILRHRREGYTRGHGAQHVRLKRGAPRLPALAEIAWANTGSLNQ
jgi:hypothetical protein